MPFSPLKIQKSLNSHLASSQRIAKRLADVWLSSTMLAAVAGSTGLLLTPTRGNAIDLQGSNQSVGALSGGGVVTNSGAAATLTVGSDNTSTTFSGVIEDGSSTTGLNKIGTGTLTLSGDSSAHTGDVTVSTGALQITGSLGGGQVTVGSGSGAALLIGSGGQFSSSELAIASGAGTNGEVTVSGAGSTLTNSGILTIGLGGSGSLLVSNSGTLNTNYLAITTGYQQPGNGGIGSLTVTGPGSTWLDSDGVDIARGTGSIGTLTISAGATAKILGGGLYESPGSNATINISGPGTYVQIGDPAATSLASPNSQNWVSLAGGTMTVSDGAKLYSSGGYISPGRGSGNPPTNPEDNSTMTVTGPGTTWTSTVRIYVGGGSGDDGDGIGKLIISDGAAVTTATAGFGMDTQSVGNLILTGHGSSLQALANPGYGYVGNVYVAYLGTGVATVSDGALLQADNEIRIATEAGSVGTLAIGAQPGSAPAAPGQLEATDIAFGDGTATLVLNHTSDHYVLSTPFTGTGAVDVLAGTTALTGDSPNFTGTAAITGGQLLVDANFGGVTATVQSGGILSVNGTLGAVTVGAGGTLSANGTVGAVTVGAGGPGTIVNTGTIAGGVGSVGVVAQGNTAITDSGTIAGGVTGNGSGRADAIDLSGGGNRLTLQTGYQILGNVVSTSGNTNGGDTLALGGNANGSFDLSQIVTTLPTAYTGFTQYYGFNTFIKTGTGTWTLTGASNSNATWVLDSGALTIGSNNAIGTGTLAMAAGTQLNLASNGIILGNPVTISGDPTVNVAGANTATISGTISDGTAPGDLVKAGSGTLILTGNDTYSGTTTIAGGGLAVDGSIANSVVTAQSGTTLSGNGTVGGVIAQNGATIAPGTSTTGTLSVAGNYAQQAGSTYVAQVTPGTATSDRILVAGSANLANGAVLDVVKTNGASYGLGSSYTVLTANGGLTGQYNLVGDLGLSDFYSLAAAYDAHDVYLTVAQTRAFADAAGTPNQVAAANGLQSLPSSSALRNAFGLLTSDAAARTALTSLEGDIHPSILTGLLNDSAVVRGAGLDRSNAALSGGQAPGQQAVCLGGKGAQPASADCTTVWLQGYGSWGNIKGDGNAASLADDLGGLLIGVDRPILRNARIGVLAGYGNDSFNGGSNASGSANDYTIGTYGGAGWGDLALRLGATYTWSNIDTSRSVAFPGYASAPTASYQGQTAQGFGELGYRIDLPQNLVGPSAVEPYVGLAYVNTSTSRFTETGGAAALSGDATNIGLGFSTLGVHGTTGFTLGRLELTANGTLGWQHAIGNVTPTNDVAFAGGSAVSVAGVPVARDAALIEAGLGTNITKAISLGLAYVGQLSGATDIESIRATLNYQF